MYIQTEITPNPNTLKFIPGKVVSESGSYEFSKKTKTNNKLINNLLALDGIEMVFLGKDFITIKKKSNLEWDNVKHNIISKINNHYSEDDGAIIKSKLEKKLDQKESFEKKEIDEKIKEILETKIRPAVARDGGDIKFVSFKNGIVKVVLQGSCSGCPSSLMTLKQGVENLLKHYVKEVNSVEAN